MISKTANEIVLYIYSIVLFHVHTFPQSLFLVHVSKYPLTINHNPSSAIENTKRRLKKGFVHSSASFWDILQGVDNIFHFCLKTPVGTRTGHCMLTFSFYPGN